MNTEQEAQQAQTIAHIRKNQNTGNDLCREDDFIAALLKIVDSQAQKIKSMEANYRELAGAWFDEREALGIQIAEQAKEIERLKRRNSLMQDVIDCALAINSARKTCGKGPIDPNIDYFAKRLSDFDSEGST